MIILDTNVLSELMKCEPNSAVMEWLDQQTAHTVWMTAITIFEIYYGLSILPKGSKRKALELGYERLIHEVFENRILPLEQSAAQAAGHLSAEQRARGRSVDFRDTLIAGIAIVHNARIATRNTKDFVAMTQSILVINPWLS